LIAEVGDGKRVGPAAARINGLEGLFVTRRKIHVRVIRNARRHSARFILMALNLTRVEADLPISRLFISGLESKSERLRKLNGALGGVLIKRADPEFITSSGAKGRYTSDVVRASSGIPARLMARL
jgi:hypothetical protein